MTAEGFIFRSDSNSEDLAGFAGAGLFDSYTMNKESTSRIKYSEELLIKDEKFQHEFMEKTGKIGKAIEDVYGEAQDIEGCYHDGKFFVVQTRPQV